MATDNLMERNIDFFADEHVASAYFGEHGLSLSQKFIVDNKGKAYIREANLGGETNVEKDANQITITHLNGWQAKNERITSCRDLGNGKLLWTALQGPAHAGNHALCINSPSKTNYSLAPFRIMKTGVTFITDTNTYNKTKDIYGESSLLRVSNTTAKKNNDGTTVYDMNMGVSLYPNRIYMYNKIYNGKTVSGGTPTQIGGSIYYVPGDKYSVARTGDYREKGNGNHFYFSRPICTSVVRLGSDGINYLQTTIAESSADFFQNTRYFLVGPERQDVLDSYHKYSQNPTLTILRGRALSLVAYGNSSDNYNGWIYLRGSRTYLSWNMELRGFRGWVNLVQSGNKKGEVLTQVKKDENGNNVYELADNAFGYYTSPVNDVTSDYTNSYRLLWVENCVLDSHSLNSMDTMSETKKQRIHGYRANRIVLGDRNNSSTLELRSGKGIMFKCSGVATDGLQYSSKVLQFKALNFTIANGNIEPRGCFRPLLNNTVRLGSASYRWHKIYLANAPVVTSDARKKEDINTIQNDSRYLTFYDNLDPVRFKWKKLGGDESNKFNLGLIAQDVEKALEKSNLTNEDFSAISCEKEEDEETAYYSLEYEQFIPLNMMKIKQLEKMIMQQQQEINELKSKLK